MKKTESEWFEERFKNSSSIGYRVKAHLHHSASPFQTIDIYQTADFGNLLVLDGAIMLTEAHEFLYHEMLVHIPLLSHPDPRRVLVIGGGDGGTVREVLLHDTVEQVDMVEIDEAVVKVSRQYLPGLAGKLDDPRVRLVIQDAVDFVKNISNEYDIVLVDSTDPIGVGEGLFTRAFYSDVHRALKAGGLVAVQSESPLSPAGEVQAILSKMKSVFPLVRLYWGPIPCYPYGSWSFTYCSKDGQEPKIRRPKAAETISRSAQYYNPDIHQSAFVLPNFMREFGG